MKAIRVYRAGGPEVLQIEDQPKPTPRPGWVLIHVKAFGLNRSEIYTRQGHSPNVKFPRILGIECVGTVEAAPGTDLAVGQTVAALMGEMGREYDGGYAEYALIPAHQVIPLQTNLDWATLAAIPETFLTAWGSLVDAMEVKAGQTLLIRGGTSSVGMAALALAKDMGLQVITTTRSPAKLDRLRQRGADHVILDTGQIAAEVKRIVPGGVHGVLELVGVATLLDSLHAVAPRGIVCNSGILCDAWVMQRFEPLVEIPSMVRLTAYSTSYTVTAEASATALQHIVEGVAQGRYHVDLDRIFQFDEIVEAHRYMEENRATGKLVVMTNS
ncbi:NADPH:quinone reductase [Ktedonosporobacter rubrisoli]|uniref:NADPH:quinone reductase n=1 Tax=Ktedonosporobacter rubrisoli TaxID=2509675 RepID=A0A4P6JQI7_KTERU|nr:zinc-binding alcohol dehydrogenase family protein [Ktedonosporobacter rubrisoli]QBD77523.1 NADPH:quinone reductase [Ktedonosporobacter rubrisoli]